jgi:hypothetical protein
VTLGVVPASASANVGASAASTGSVPGALVWGDSVFTTRASLEKWLERRGENLTTWSAQHPRARRILAGAEAPPVRFRPSQFAPHLSPRPWLSSGSSSTGASLVPIVPIVLVLGLLLVALAALPFPVVAPEWRPGVLVYHHRITLLIVGVTVVGATAIAKLVG